MALMSNKCLSRDEFCTVLAEASAIVNNTPLWTNPNHPDDPTPLTPAMILTMREVPNPQRKESFTEHDLNVFGPARYRRVQYLAEQFWQRWRTEYLSTLTRRHKWKTRRACIRVGDIVLMRDRGEPRNHWPMGRVEATKTSADGLVRSVTLRLAPLPGMPGKQRYLERALSDIVLLVPSEGHSC